MGGIRIPPRRRAGYRLQTMSVAALNEPTGGAPKIHIADLESRGGPGSGEMPSTEPDASTAAMPEGARAGMRAGRSRPPNLGPIKRRVKTRPAATKTAQRADRGGRHSRATGPHPPRTSSKPNRQSDLVSAMSAQVLGQFASALMGPPRVQAEQEASRSTAPTRSCIVLKYEYDTPDSYSNVFCVFLDEHETEMYREVGFHEVGRTKEGRVSGLRALPEGPAPLALAPSSNHRRPWTPGPKFARMPITVLCGHGGDTREVSATLETLYYVLPETAADYRRVMGHDRYTKQAYDTVISAIAEEKEAGEASSTDSKSDAEDAEHPAQPETPESPVSVLDDTGLGGESDAEENA